MILFPLNKNINKKKWRCADKEADKRFRIIAIGPVVT